MMKKKLILSRSYYSRLVVLELWIMTLLNCIYPQWVFLSLFNKNVDTKMNCFKMVINTPVQNLYSAYMNDEQLKKDVFFDSLIYFIASCYITSDC